ncbi:hypothetical protein JXR93_06375 [bacterium]|nr:hypothetical protein [bacterium]
MRKHKELIASLFLFILSLIFYFIRDIPDIVSNSVNYFHTIIFSLATLYSLFLYSKKHFKTFLIVPTIISAIFIAIISYLIVGGVKDISYSEWIPRVYLLWVTLIFSIIMHKMEKPFDFAFQAIVTFIAISFIASFFLKYGILLAILNSAWILFFGLFQSVKYIIFFSMPFKDIELTKKLKERTE